MTLLVTILSLFLTNSIYSQSFKTDRYLQVNHSVGIEIFNFYRDGKIKLETSSDTPQSYSDVISFNEGWSKYYNFTTKKFVSQKEGNRSYSLETTWSFNSNIISDGQYSNWTINSHSQKINSEFDIDTYKCTVDLPPTNITNKVCTIHVIFDKIRYKKYVFVEYDKLTYIYGIEI